MVKRILDIVGWIGFGLVIIAVVVKMVPALDRYGAYVQPLAIAGLVCVLLYTLGQWREIAVMFQGRQARYGTLAGVSVLVVLGILIAINYIGARQNKRWDLTANKQFSLSDQSRTVLSKLDSPLQVMVFARETDFPQYQDKVKEYEYASKKISTEYVDPDKKPAIAKQNQVQQYGTIVFNYKGRTERVTSDAEQDLTNGIIKVVTGQQKKVYFTQGHGEKETASQSDRDSYSAIAAALGRENYTVDKLVIAQQGAMPDDAAVVVVAGPKTDFFPNEIDALKKYLDKGGKLLLMLDPPDRADSPQPTNLIAVAHDWGVDVGNNVVVDVSGMGRLIGTDASVPVAASYPSHAITKNGGFNYITAFPMARSAAPVTGGVNGRTATSFIETSPRSWAETDVKGLLTSGQVSLDESKGDKKGPVVIGSAVNVPTAEASKTPAQPDAPKPETRIAVVGDSDFAANSGLGIQGNRDLFLNIVGWLSQQENLISIRPREADDRRITMTASSQYWVNWLSILIIPGFIFGSGVYSWWRRR
jgi:ABC-type uncharacterized transport system involved in gliding motility auxiliary subunit